jgi:hypothetical protein
MNVLVDSSVWIDYFRKSPNVNQDNQEWLNELDTLIDENIVVINELILTELIPFLRVKKKHKLISILNEIECIPLNIAWQNIIDIQVRCIKNGINTIGIPDLIIAQNSLQNDLVLFSFDKHFKLINETIEKLYIYQEFTKKK